MTSCGGLGITNCTYMLWLMSENCTTGAERKTGQRKRHIEEVVLL
jgi:hypothetical protein